VEGVPFNTTVVLRNPVLDVVVGPHGICVVLNGNSIDDGINIELGNLFGSEG
jgi:hypothetical protein